ncbi:hypothetical protein ABIE67_000201 [Streptomyces sp. V4I8]
MKLRVVEEPKSDGVIYTTTYQVERPLPVAGGVATKAQFTVIGMGGMHAKLTVGRHFTADTWVMATPTGRWRMRLWVAGAIDYSSLPAPLRLLTRRPTEWAGASLLNRWNVRDVSADFPIFHHKTLLRTPNLTTATAPSAPSASGPSGADAPMDVKQWLVWGLGGRSPASWGR